MRSVEAVGRVEAKGVEALGVEEVDAGFEVRAVLLPLADGVVGVDAGGFEDGVPELGDGGVGDVVGEDELGPVRGGGGDDGPVDGVLGDELHGGLGGLGGGNVGAGDLGGVLFGEQGGVGAGDGHAGGSVAEGGGDGVLQPDGGVVEGGVGAVLVAGEDGGVVGVEGGDEEGAGA